MLSLSRLHPAKNGIFHILIFHFRISVLSCALWHQNYVKWFFSAGLQVFFQYSMCLLFSVLCFVDNCLTYCPFSLGHCIVCSSMYGFWLPLWYLQAFQKELMFNMHSIFWQCAIFRIFPLCCAFLICLSISWKKKND